ncbi:MAG: GNAT family N-acetyltransferase [Chloroflexi bacterium]|nr:GNAT family N-acetyltransferase [Chloroflexota bacterium]
MLKGEKVILREKRLEDAADDYRWRTDPELARLDAASSMRSTFSDYLVSYAEELRYPTLWQERFAIDTLDGKHIGNCMYFDIDEKKKQAELGILIGDREYWDKGYGADAICTLLDYIFSATEVERIYLHTLEWNVRAQKSFAKCGFAACGRSQRGGHRFVVMEVFRDKFKAARKKPARVPTGERQEGEA